MNRPSISSKIAAKGSMVNETFVPVEIVPRRLPTF